MEFKLSERLKAIFDIVRAVASYLTIFGVAFYLVFKDKMDSVDWTTVPGIVNYVLYILAALLITFPLFLYYFDRIKLRYILFKGNLKSFIIEKNELVIDIYDKRGRFAELTQKIFFHKLSNKTREKFINVMEFSGKVVASTIQTLNCTNSLSRDQQKITMCYSNQMKKLNQITNFFKENDRFFIYSFTLKNCFIDKEESWEMVIEHLCQDYSLEVILPAGRNLRYAKFVRNNKAQSKVDDIQPIVLRSSSERQKICLRVMNFDKNESFKLVWALD